MRKCEMFYDRKAEPGTSHRSRTRAINPVEALEYSREMFRRDSVSGVRYMNAISLA